jgi:GT2 family glycosyltransferase
MRPNEVALRVSVVVASHRSAYVNDLAESLTQQMASGDSRIEAIVVADYPVEEFQKRFPAIRWLFHPDYGIPAKRNAGCAAAVGEIFAFIDDDCVPSQGWSRQGMAYLDNHKDAAGCEGRTVVESGALAAPVAEFRRLEKAGYRTNNIFFRKSVFESAGGFDARFAFQREDADLAFAVLSLGYTIGYCPDAIVTHRLRHDEAWDLLKNCVNRRFDPLLYKKHPVHYRNHIGSPIPPGIGLVMGFHALLLIVLSVCVTLWPFAAALDVSAALVLSVRRNRNGRNGIFWIGRDFISFLAAPFVIEGALIYGSIKFRQCLLF